MNIQPFQLAIFIAMAALLFTAYTVYKQGRKKTALLILMVVLVLPPMLPIKFKQEGGSSLESSTTRIEDIPEKVVVDKPPFEKRQEAEMQNFNETYEESRNEIHN